MSLRFPSLLPQSQMAPKKVLFDIETQTGAAMTFNFHSDNTLSYFLLLRLRLSAASTASIFVARAHVYPKVGVCLGEARQALVRSLSPYFAYFCLSGGGVGSRAKGNFTRGDVI